MKIVVVDNELQETLRLLEYMREAFPEATVLPEPNTAAFNEWEEVYNFVRSVDDEFVVLCLDLALSSGKVDFKDVERGLDQGSAIRQLKAGWVLVAYTNHGKRATLFPGFKEAFDGLIDKAVLDSLVHQDEREARVLYVKNAVSAAIKNRAPDRGQEIFPIQARIIDSLGMRMFQAVFGDSAISEIIENETASWNDVELEALTTGHSGAFLLSLKGTFDNRPQSLALKVARDEVVIQAEVEAPSKNIRELGLLNGRLGYFDPKKKQLSAGNGVYYRQAFEDGRRLIELLPGSSNRASREILSPVVRLCLDIFRSVDLSKCGEAPARRAFKLTPIDVSRLETSSQFMGELGETLTRSGMWPTSLPNPYEITGEVSDLVRNWSNCTLGDVSLKTVVQHGDLNPGNVLVRKEATSTPILIDLSRLGHWPIGYDLSRLSLLLRLRLMDGDKNRDWLPNGLVDWLGESVAQLNPRGDGKSSLCAAAQYCDDQFRGFLNDIPDDKHRQVVAYGYRLGTLWDLIKIASYQDVSPFKRLWALIETWKLNIELKDQIPKNLVGE